jgi:hypothetical protein
MALDTEIEAAAQAIHRVWAESSGDATPWEALSFCDRESHYASATAALAAAECARNLERQKNCKHENRQTSWMIAPDGAKVAHAYCPDCEHVAHVETARGDNVVLLTRRTKALE